MSYTRLHYTDADSHKHRTQICTRFGIGPRLVLGQLGQIKQSSNTEFQKLQQKQARVLLGVVSFEGVVDGARGGMQNYEALPSVEFLVQEMHMAVQPRAEFFECVQSLQARETTVSGYRTPDTPPKVHSPSQNVQKARAYRPTGPCSYSFIIMIMSTISGPSQQQANWQTACPGPHAMPCLQAMGERESMRVGIPFGERLVRHHVRLMRGFIVVNCCYRVRLG